MQRNHLWAALLACVVSFLVAPIARGQEKPWLVYMQPTVFTATDGVPPGIYVELLRQSVLLSAREEFGALTRDGNCSEPIPADAGAYAGILRIGIAIYMRNPGTMGAQITVTRPDGKPEVLADTFTFAEAASWVRSHERMIERYEQFSRSEATGLLKRAGLPIRKPAGAPGQKLPEGLQQRLGEMCFVAQYDVLRQTHPLLLAQSDSEELLTTIARAYAHLGQLSRCNFDGSSKAYAARSLLYSQRLVEKRKISPAALQVRAYAKALAGMHANALADLQQAKDQPAAVLPVWAQAADLLCHYQRRDLLALGEKDASMAEIAPYFAFLTAEHESSPALVLDTARTVLTQSPHCLRVFDGACAQAGVAPSHALTESGFPMLVELVRAEWPKIEANVPQPVRTVREQARKKPNLAEAVADVARALVTCDVPAEPSWSALGNLFQQADYLVVFRRAHFMSRKWAVPTSDYLAEMEPLYADHPLKDYLLSLGDEYQQSRAARMQFLSKLNVQQTFPLMFHIGRDTLDADTGGAMIGGTLCDRFASQFDRAAYDWDMMLMGVRDSDDPQNVELKRRYAPLLNTVSPFDPTASAIMVEQDWEGVQPQIEKWKIQFKDSPVFLNAMAKHLRSEKKWLEAAKYLEQQLAIASDVEACQALADCYNAAQQPDKAVLALEGSLSEEDTGLDHARTRLKLASYYKQQGNHTKGIAYAEQAAASWAAWAMFDAALYHEELGNWDQANLWFSRLAERYSEYSEWYLFCARTGYGNRVAATRGMMQQLQRPLNLSDREVVTKAIVCFLFERQGPQATALLKRLVQQSHEPWAAMLLAVGNDAQVTREERIQMLRDCAVAQPEQPVPGQPSFYRPYLNDLAAMMAEAASAKAPLDMKEFREICKQTPATELANVLYPAGMYMLQMGKQKEGIDLLKECVAHPNHRKATWQLAIQELRDRKLAPARLLKPTTAPAIAPAAK